MHTLFFAFALFFVKYQSEKNIEKYINNIYLENNLSFHKAINVLNKNMDLIEKLLINEKILKILANADKNPVKSRNLLLEEFHKKYQILKQNGFYLVHFHLQNGTSLIRFHKIKNFGDNLYDFRPAVKYVQTTRKVFHGFEIGKGIGGFRSIYPLIYHNRLVGSFEISFSINNLIKYMFENEKMALVVDKKNISKYIYKNERNILKTCKLNENYYIWGNICKLFQHKHNVDFYKNINIVENILVFSYPIKDFNNKKEGYILFLQPENSIYALNEVKNNCKRLQIIIIILYFVILIMIIGVHIYYKSKRQAEIDYLTKVYNRKGCVEKLKMLDHYSLLVIDIDHFKKINDKYGHDVGDLILKELAHLLSENVRKDSDIVCRWGGEEFLVILKNTNKENALKVAEKLRKIIGNHDFRGIKVTISIGLNEFEDNFEKTFKLADIKLYQAKKSGRNRVVF
jgi:diguanylate cyclase (GGDEF)-like protein